MYPIYTNIEKYVLFIPFWRILICWLEKWSISGVIEYGDFLLVLLCGVVVDGIVRPIWHTSSLMACMDNNTTVNLVLFKY